MAGLSQGDGGSHLGQIWHQVVGDAVGVLPDEARGVRANGVEIPQQLHRPVLPWRRRGPSQMETTPHSSSISEYIQKNIRAVQKIKHSVCHNVCCERIHKPETVSEECNAAGKPYGIVEERTHRLGMHEYRAKSPQS